MEEYVTKREFLEFKKQMEQRHTEEMKPIRLDVASKDVLDRLEDLKQEFQQELKTVSDTWLETMQEHYIEHTARFDKIEQSMATKQDISALRQEMATMKEDIIDAIRKYSQPGKN